MPEGNAINPVPLISRDTFLRSANERKRRFAHNDFEQIARRLRPKIDRLCNVHDVVKQSESAMNVSDERGSEHDPDDSEIPTFYDICKQCWTMFETCREYQYYECIEWGDCDYS